MNKIFKNKKIVIFSAIALSLLVYFMISINFADAAIPIMGPGVLKPVAGAGAGGAVAGQFASAIAGKALDAASWGLMIYGVLLLGQYVLWWLISYGYTLLTAAVNMALDPSWFQIDAVLNGWRLVRDFANIWFILILLFIAIGTILRAQSYQAKKLLPTLLLVALVINFSLPITGFIIDISNIVSFQFLKAICPEVKNGEHCDFSANLENALDSKGFSQSLAKNIGDFQPAPAPDDTGDETGLLGAPKAQAIAPLVIAAGVWKVVQVTSIALIGFDLANSLFAQASPLGGIAVGPFVSLVVTNLFLLLTAFVILSLALLFLIRIASLIFLAILSPLGFAAAIIPATQKYSQKWWDYLFTQSFFAPFSLFFLWISLSLMGSIKESLAMAEVSYDFTNPANVRIIFYIFSLILMYGSIWIAKQMGAMGADSVIKWWGSIQKGITGFASGLAGRLLVAPIGAAALGAGIPQAIGRISPLAGVKAKEFTEYLSKRGKAPEAAEAKAALGMQLAPAERAKYFANLDRAAKEAMLRKMKGEERESFIAGLFAAQDKDGNPIAVQQVAGKEARSILESQTFTGEEQLKSAVDKFKFEKGVVAQWEDFGKLPKDVQKQFLLGIEDADKRAGFLQHVKEKAQEAQRKGETDKYNQLSGAFNDANTFLETSPGFSKNQLYTNKLARERVEHTEEQKVQNLANYFWTLGKTREELAELEAIRRNPDAREDEKKKLDDFVGEQKRRFRFGMEQSQRLDVLSGAKTDEQLKLVQEWFGQMDPKDQDELARNIGKDASSDTVVAFIKSISTKKPDGTANPERDLAIKKMVLSKATAQQLAKVAIEGRGTDLEALADQIAREKLSKQNFGLYGELKGGETPPPRGRTPRAGGSGPGPTGGAPSAGDGGTPTSQAPVAPTPRPAAPATSAEPTTSETSTTISPEIQNIVKTSDGINVARYINKLNPDTDPQTIRDALEALGLESRKKIQEALLTINPIIQVQFVDKIDPSDTQKFEETLAQNIKDMARPDLELQILENPSVLTNNLFLRAILQGSNIQKLIYLFDHKQIGEFVKEQLNKGMPEDKELHAQAIADMFEKEFKNKELAITISDLRRKQKEQLSPIGREVKEYLFGE